MEAERRRCLAESGSGTSSLATRPTHREVPDLMSWLYCFNLYAAAVGAKYPNKGKDMFAYQALMIGEVRRCGGKGWLMYDVGFRQYISSWEKADFSWLNQTLFATTMLEYGNKPQACPLCNLPDHSQEECALNPSRAVLIIQVTEQSGSGARREKEEARKTWPLKNKPRQGACYAWNSPRSCSRPGCVWGIDAPSASGNTPVWCAR